MKPVDQTKFGLPEGNCFAACVATIFGLPLEAVPHFMHLDADEWFLAFQRWSRAELGHDALMVLAKASDAWFKAFRAPCIVSGPAARGVDHATVWADAKLFHDPHPSREGLLSINDVVVFVPMAPRSAGFGGPAVMAAVEKVTATVYRGGGRRWFSKRAAYLNEAKMRVRAKCECQKHPCISDSLGCNCCGYCAYCEFSPGSDDTYKTRLTRRLARWLRWCDERAAAPESESRS